MGRHQVSGYALTHSGAQRYTGFSKNGYVTTAAPPELGFGNRQRETARAMHRPTRWSLAHAVLVQKTLDRERVRNPLKVYDRAKSALAELEREGAQLPRVILLDLKLSGMSGLEMLGRIKRHTVLESVPVVILPSSAAENDRARAYEVSANSYLVKPISFEKFRKMIKEIGLYGGVWNAPPADGD